MTDAPDPLTVVQALESAAATEAALLRHDLLEVRTAADARAALPGTRRLASLMGWLAAGEERLLRLTLDRRLPGAGDPYRFDQGALAATVEALVDQLEAMAGGAGDRERVHRLAIVLHDRLTNHCAKINALLVPATAELVPPADRPGLVRDVVGALPPAAQEWVWPMVIDTASPDRARPVAEALLAVLLPPVAVRVRSFLAAGLSDERRSELADLLDEP